MSSAALLWCFRNLGSRTPQPHETDTREDARRCRSEHVQQRGRQLQREPSQHAVPHFDVRCALISLGAAFQDLLVQRLPRCFGIKAE